MSDLYFPKLRGLKWDIQREPKFSTVVQPSVVPGLESRISYDDQPQWKITLGFETLRDHSPDESGATELETILGFFQARGGDFDSFLLNLTDLTGNERDSIVMGAQIGTGDGATSAFQIGRTYGGFREACYAPQGVDVLVNGAVADPATYTLTNGLVTFAAPPAADAVITANYTHVLRVRFADPSAQINNFSFKLYELQEISLVSLRRP